MSLVRQVRSGAQIVRALGSSLKVDNKAASTELTVPGTSFNEYDRTGNISLSYLTRLYEWARNSSWAHPDCYLGKTVSEGNNLLVFMVEGKLTITNQFYQRTPALFCGEGETGLPFTSTDTGLKIGLQLNYVGKSSLQLTQRIRHLSSEKLLTSAVFSFVLVDKNTKRPGVIPQYLREDYPHLAEKTPEPRMTPLVAPDHAYVYDLKVHHSDLDSYYHSNHSAYVRFCMNCGVTASYAGYFKTFRGDLGKYKVRTISQLFTSESLAGDHLRVLTWEDCSTPGLVYFQVVKAGSPIYHMATQFETLTS